jgi:transposase InsO family protein
MARREVPMSVRRLVVEVDPEMVNVTAFCRAHGISTWFFWDLRRRHALLGDVVLEPASRAPHRVANRIPAVVEDEIVAMRKQLEELGLDAGPATIGFHLRRQPGVEAIPSDSGIWRVLSRRGFITPDPSKAPKHAGRSFEAERANECWQIDDTGWELADGTEVKIINVVDDRSRVAVSSLAVRACTSEASFAAFSAGAAQWGWPSRFLSDNAKAFRHGLAEMLRHLGIAAGHARPYHPQTCGKVERFHQTLKRYLAAQDPPETIEDLQAQLDAFIELYNHHRPHRSLDRQFPAVVWQQAPKSGPADTPLGAPTTVHHRVVDRNGIVTIGRRYAISLGAAHRARHVTVVITGPHAHVFANGKLLRALTLDPNRRNQPIYDRPGRPRRLP